MTIEAAALAGAGMLTRRRLAAEIGVTEETLRNWEREHGLPVIKVGRKGRFYVLSEVLAWMKKRRTAA